MVPAPPLDPRAFLRTVPPFDALNVFDFELAAGALEVAFYPAGTKVINILDRPSNYLFIVRKGAVRLERYGEVLATLEEGEVFGYPSMLTGTVSFDVVVEEDLLAYRIPEERFHALMARPVFARFFTRGLAERLRSALTGEDEASFAPDVHAAVGTLVARDLVSVPATATVGEAARLMSKAKVSSVLVLSEPPAILTDRDLRNKVLAAGRGPDTPVLEVSTRPIRTAPEETPVYGAWQTMTEHGVHHLPLTREGRIVGIVTGTDLLRQQTIGPLFALKKVERMADRSALEGHGRDVARLVGSLFSSGLPAPQVARLASHVNDALVRKLLGWAEQDLGPPPVPYAWIVFGSEGRYEQTLLTDQDNALVWADTADEAVAAYFEEFARRVVDDLLAAGFPPCAGGYMATNWHGPLRDWCARFASWIESPRAEAVLKAAIFFDFRAVGGGLDLTPIARIVESARSMTPFLSHMARAALTFAPPFGTFRSLKEDFGRLDLKKGGIAPIVGLARVFALDAGTQATNTVDRLAAAADAGFLTRDEAATLSEAFPFLMRLRLRSQLRSLAADEKVGNTVALETLSAIERRHLKEAFQAIRDAQKNAAWRYHVDLA